MLTMKVFISGIGGRMGDEVVKACLADKDIEIVGGGKVVELDGKSIDPVSELTILGLPASEFNTYNLKIEGATQQTSVVFKSAENIKFARWFIDDIIITQ